MFPTIGFRFAERRDGFANVVGVPCIAVVLAQGCEFIQQLRQLGIAAFIELAFQHGFPNVETRTVAGRSCPGNRASMKMLQVPCSATVWLCGGYETDVGI